MNSYSKAIATIIGAAVSVLLAFNVEVSQELQAAIILVVTTLATIIAPANKPT